MKAIYKYPITDNTMDRINLSPGTRLLQAEVQGNNFYLWATVNKANHLTVPYEVYSFLTGEDINEELLSTLTYLNTVVRPSDNYVLHFFYRRA